MKKLFALLAVAALTAVGCDDKKTTAKPPSTISPTPATSPYTTPATSPATSPAISPATSPSLSPATSPSPKKDKGGDPPIGLPDKPKTDPK